MRGLKSPAKACSSQRDKFNPLVFLQGGLCIQKAIHKNLASLAKSNWRLLHFVPLCCCGRSWMMTLQVPKSYFMKVLIKKKKKKATLKVVPFYFLYVFIIYLLQLFITFLYAFFNCFFYSLLNNMGHQSKQHKKLGRQIKILKH